MSNARAPWAAVAATYSDHHTKLSASCSACKLPGLLAQNGAERHTCTSCTTLSSECSAESLNSTSVCDVASVAPWHATFFVKVAMQSAVSGEVGTPPG